MTTLEVFWIFLKLGLTSFGGPIAHLGYFHREFVERRKWLTEHAYADLVALCQFLPGPASSQVGIALGLSRAGYAGAIAAWLGFTLPSAIILVLIALGISNFSNYAHSGLVHGLKIAAVGIVAQAIWMMWRRLCPDRERATIATMSAIIATVAASTFGQVMTILLGGILGWLFLNSSQELPHESLHISITQRAGAFFLTTFCLLLTALPIAALFFDNHALQLFDSFFRAGSLVFGGGHVVLPLLKAAVVTPGWVSSDLFMAGYGAAQAIPGPLFTFTAYLGAVSAIQPSGWIGASICLTAAFLPSFLLVFGILPFWERLRKIYGIETALMGINAAVVGLMLAAFYHPVWTSAIFRITDFALAAFVFLILVFWNAPSWTVVMLCAGAGYLQII